MPTLQLRTREDFAQSHKQARIFFTTPSLKDPRDAQRKIVYTFASEAVAQEVVILLNTLVLPKDAHVDCLVDGPKLAIVGSRYALQQLRLADWAKRAQLLLNVLGGHTQAFEVSLRGVHTPYFCYTARGATRHELLQGLRTIPAAIRPTQDPAVWFIFPTASVGPAVALTSAALGCGPRHPATIEDTAYGYQSHRLYGTTRRRLERERTGPKEAHSA